MFVLTKEEIYEAEKFTIEEIGIKEEILMEIAGQKMADEISKRVNLKDVISVFCGCHNNAGDGFVVARKLKSMGYVVNVILTTEVERFKNSVFLNYNICKNLGFNFLSIKDIDEVLLKTDFVVDALFGIGFKKELRPPYDVIMDKINKSNAKVISLDIPSGVCCDDAKPAIGAIRADLTLTVSFLKQSAVLYPARLFYGEIKIVDANIILKCGDFFNLKRIWDENEFKKTALKKALNTNKSKEGKVLIIAGSDNMPGAVSFCSRACLEAGVGLLSIACTDKVKKILATSVLEATYVDCKEERGCLKDFEMPEKVDTIVCGPGLARNEITRNVVKKVILQDVDVLLDADALFFLDEEMLNIIKNRKFATVLTPHEGEMARLCGLSCEYVQNNRFNLSREKAVLWKIYLVLKGPYTILTTSNKEQFVNFSGNEGLAKGGSGDVLSGIIAAFMAKRKNLQHLISNAVFLHGKLADFLIKKGESFNSITPTKLIENLKYVW